MMETHQKVMEASLKGLHGSRLGQFGQYNKKMIVINYNQLNKIKI